MADETTLKPQVSKFLGDSIDKALGNLEGKVTEHFGHKLVELINQELPSACPSAEGFRFVVSATVTEEWGQGCSQGARCLWDNSRDTVINVERATARGHVSVAVFFVADLESPDSSEEEED